MPQEGAESSEREVRNELDDRELTASSWMRTGAWLPTKQATLTATVPAPASDVYGAARTVIGNLARRDSLEVSAAEDGGGRLRGRFGSGWANMNTTIAQVEVRSLDATRAELTVRAGAKEGLLNQHSSEKAVRRIRDAVAQMLGAEITAEPTPGDV